MFSGNYHFRVPFIVKIAKNAVSESSKKRTGTKKHGISREILVQSAGRGGAPAAAAAPKSPLSRAGRSLREKPRKTPETPRFGLVLRLKQTGNAPRGSGAAGRAAFRRPFPPQTFQERPSKPPQAGLFRICKERPGFGPIGKTRPGDFRRPPGKSAFRAFTGSTKRRFPAFCSVCAFQGVRFVV